MSKRKRASVIVSDPESDECEAAEETKKPAKKRHKNAQKAVIASDLDASDMKETVVAKPRKKKKADHPVLASDSDEEATTSANKKTPKRATKSPKLPLQKNTLDNYFTKVPKSSTSPSNLKAEADKKTSQLKEKTNTVKQNRIEISPDDFFHAPKNFSSSAGNTTQPKISISTVKPVAESSRSNPTTATSKLNIKNNAEASSGKQQKTATTILETSPVKQLNEKSDASRSPQKKPKPSRASSSNYVAYLHRDGPKNLGERDLPAVSPKALLGLTIVITGVLDYFERDEVEKLIADCGGKCTKSVSKKTSVLVTGREPGVSKLEKATQFKTKRLSETEFYDFINEKSGAFNVSPRKSSSEKRSESTVRQSEPSLPRTCNSSSSQPKVPVEPVITDTHGPLPTDGETLLWVDKYKPTGMKQIIGQQGANSCANKLHNWLKSWHSHLRSGVKKGTSGLTRWNDDGSHFKAALLSGPPGIGKTTTATIVCKELGFSFVELNASDKRNKKSLNETVSTALNMHSVVDFLSGECHEKSAGLKHCVLMDEVDGMSGNEDRGGVQELIQLIKASKIPIICMCNDRNHIKMRSLGNYTYDLRFPKPRPEQIKASILSIAAKEGITVPGPALTDIIAASNNDIRQSIHNIELWCTSTANPNEGTLKKEANKAQKDLKFGPFDLVRKVFSPSETRDLNLNQKADFFFQDYSFEPLFVQQNYLNVDPESIGQLSGRDAQMKLLDIVSDTAEAIAQGDVISKTLRETNNWSLLPLQAIFSSVIPGELMKGHFHCQIEFPAWLGKNSTTGKVYRQASSLRMHLRLSTSGCSQQDLLLDYLKPLQEAVTRPLSQQGASGIDSVIQTLDAYNLLKDDMDTLIEMAAWPGSANPLAGLDSKVKAALTRTYNKGNHLTPYAVEQTVKKAKLDTLREPMLDEFGNEIEDGEGSASESDSEGLDPMIKFKKPAPSKRKNVPDAGGKTREVKPKRPKKT